MFCQMVADPARHQRCCEDGRGPEPAPVHPPFLRMTAPEAASDFMKRVLAQPGPCIHGGGTSSRGPAVWPTWGGRDGYPGPRPSTASCVSQSIWWLGRWLGSLWRRRRLRGSSSWGRSPLGTPKRQETEAAAGAGAGGAPWRAAHRVEGALGCRPAGGAWGRVGTQMRP